MGIDSAQALRRMADYCSRAERCSYDVRRRLVALEIPEEGIKDILERLQKEKFISDERFCRSFINDKIRFNKWGIAKIRYELKKRNIPDSIYNPLIAKLPQESFEEQLIQIIISKNKTVKGKDDYDKKKKLIRFGLGRGFSMEMVIKCVNKIYANDFENDL